jgi:hypothetical protein
VRSRAPRLVDDADAVDDDDEDDLIQVRRGTRSRPRRDARGRMDGWRRATDRTTARAMGRAGRSTAR